MIFASDLDRTLIYSKTFLADYSGCVKAVEDGVYQSYMTQRGAELLLDLAQKVMFIPCTTRTIEQYRRIQFFQQECQPEYAVVSNGGNRIIRGKIDREYRETVGRRIEQECLAAEDVYRQFLQIYHPHWAQKLRQADELFFYCIIDRQQLPRELEEFKVWAEGQNWKVSVQGRKLYLVPGVLDKGVAVAEINELTGKSGFWAAGDSLLDWPLLTRAARAFCPRHGELYETFLQKEESRLNSNLVVTAASGLLAAEEIVEKVNEQWQGRHSGVKIK